MYRNLIFLILISPLSLAMEFEEANKLAIKQFQENNPMRNAYISERMGYENSISLDRKGNCYQLPGGGITQVIRIDTNGVIDLVVSSVNNEKSECFKKVYLGTKYRKHFGKPIYSRMLMGY